MSGCYAHGYPDGLQNACLGSVSGLQPLTREGFEIVGVEYKARMGFGTEATEHRSWHMRPSRLLERCGWSLSETV
jgi:hypothetical protein